jgi:AraC-like DNA-binding protein
LALLSTLANTSAKKVSEVLSTRLKTNFNDLVNSYRVEEVKAKLISPQFSHLTIFGIALESGFASKSSFNRAFKKNTGFTPSEYKINLQKGVPSEEVRR